MNQQQRHQFILNCLNAQSEVSVQTLANQLDVTQETIRRDLTFLENAQQLKKIHGGALRVKSYDEIAFENRLQQNTDNKVMIARQAITLLSPGNTLFLDHGSTTLALTDLFSQVNNLVVFTTSPLLAENIWAQNATTEIHLIGGQYMGKCRQTVGAYAIEMVKQFKVDFAFVGCVAIDPESGFRNQIVEEAMLARQMLLGARYKVVLGDSSKIGSSGLAKIAGFDEVDMLITTPFDHPELSTALAQYPIECRVATTKVTTT